VGFLQPARRRRLWLGVVALILPLLAFLVVPLYGFLWQELHGDSFSFREWTGKLPRGFYVSSLNSASSQLWRLDLGRPIIKTPYGHISLLAADSGSAFSRERDYERFGDAVTQAARESQYAFSQQLQVPVDGTVAYCLEFTRVRNNAQLQLRCGLEGTSLFVYYEGHEKYREAFLSFLQALVRR